jgi:hypothetical protein
LYTPVLDPAAERIHGLTIYRKDAAGELIEQVHARTRWLLGRWILLNDVSRFQEADNAHQHFTRPNADRDGARGACRRCLRHHRI